MSELPQKPHQTILYCRRCGRIIEDFFTELCGQCYREKQDIIGEIERLEKLLKEFKI